MKRSFGLQTLAVGAIAAVVLATAAQAQTTRWGDWAASIQLGSAELSVEKRLFEPGKDEVACMRCKHYVELRAGVDEQDFEGIDFDITHVIAAYRYYAYVQMKEGPNGLMTDGAWAAYVGLGLGRYELDPGEPISGWSLRTGVDRKVTEACRKGTAARWYMDWEVNATYHRLSIPGADFDYWNFQTGPRFIFPSSRDIARDENLKICSQQEG